MCKTTATYDGHLKPYYIVEMREGNIKYQFPLKKGIEHFPRKKMKLHFDSIVRANYSVDFYLETLDFYFLRLAERR